MGKVSLKDRGLKTPKKKRQLRSSSNKYLKPGALSQLRYAKILGAEAKLCTDLGKKRGDVQDSEKIEKDMLGELNIIDQSPLFFSPMSLKHNVLRTPKTPRVEECESDSLLESLPMDLLVKIMCHLHHDQLRAVFHVSQRIRIAVLVARQVHFNYTTPDRSRQETLMSMTPRPAERWPFVRGGNGIWMRTPHTPKAPRHGPRPPPRIKFPETRLITAALFQEAFPTSGMVPSAFPKPLCKSLTSNRVLFYEDELCQAVSQNKLL